MATNEHFAKKGIRDIPKSHQERRLFLIELAKKYKDVKDLYLVDRFILILTGPTLYRDWRESRKPK